MKTNMALIAAAFAAMAANAGIPQAELAMVRDYGAKKLISISKSAPKSLRFTKAEAEAIHSAWMVERKAIGYVEKRPFKYGHAFMKWASLYRESHPDYLGLTPYGTRGISPEGWSKRFLHQSKLCVSNPSVVDKIIADWQRKGAKEYLCVCENDGLMGFCRCGKCCALDVGKPGEAFTLHKTDRYLDFWNRVCERAIAVRPDVKVIAYAYSAYRFPPRRERVRYPDALLLGYVPSIFDDAKADIAGWRKAGLKRFFVRPNFLCNKGVLPRGLERFIYDNYRQMREAGAIGTDHDLYGDGDPAMAFEVYGALRQAVDANVAFETVERDWCARFGAAAETAKAYYARVRARCGVRWPTLLADLKGKYGDFLDDSHFGAYIYRLHTKEDLRGDLDLLESFSGAELDAVAAKRFADLKTNVRHQMMSWCIEAGDTSQSRAELETFRAANRDALGPMLGFWYRRFPDPADKDAARSVEVLPPGIGTALGADRFERSAKAAGVVNASKK